MYFFKTGCKKKARGSGLLKKTAMISLLGLFIVLVLIVGLAGFRHAGRWLVLDDPMSRADVILVLSGGLPYRAEEAAKIYAMGYAPEVWISRPDSPAEKMEKSAFTLSVSRITTAKS
jgi:hypothetical protein